MKYLSYIISAVLFMALFTSCHKDDEEPEINLGYEDSYQVPDPTPMTHEDSIALAERQQEYNDNAK